MVMRNLAVQQSISLFVACHEDCKNVGHVLDILLIVNRHFVESGVLLK